MIPLPDKYVRKCIFDNVNDVVVHEKNIKIYDTNVTNDESNEYILMSTQNNEILETSKCGFRFQSFILLDIVTKYNNEGNTGSRVFADDILDSVIQILGNDIELEGGLNIYSKSFSFPPDITEYSDKNIIHRKFVRMELLIN